MKLTLIALTTLAAVAAAAPSVEREGLEVRADEPKKVKKLTFYGWDGKAQEIGDDTTVFYSDPDVVANVDNKDSDKDKRFFFGWLYWNSWNSWRGRSCNYCHTCTHHYWGGCRTGRCCASW